MRYNKGVMKKYWKITLVSLAIIIAVVFVNGCYYVFNGQHKSMKKLQQGKELNLYECCSIYSMHCAVWMFGWPIAPEAANECFKLHFPKEDGREYQLLSFSKKFYASEKYQEARKQLENANIGDSVSITWSGNEDYAITSKEHRMAIAVNPCVVSVRYIASTGERILKITSPMVYPKYSKKLFKFM